MRLHHHHGLLLRHDQLAELVAHVGQDVLGRVQVQALLDGGGREPEAHRHGVALLGAQEALHAQDAFTGEGQPGQGSHGETQGQATGLAAI